MTKKLFAIVLAAMLAITMFTFPTFAAGSVTIDNIAADNTISFSWGVASGAAKYQITFRSGSTILNTQTIVIKSDSENSVANCRSTYKATKGGEITITVQALDATGAPFEVYTGTANVPTQQTGSNGVKVSGSGNSTTVTWGAVSGVTRYCIEWVDKTSPNFTNPIFTTGTSCTIDKAMADIKSITVRKSNDNNGVGDIIGSWSYSSGGSGSGIQANGITIGNISNGVATVSWSRMANDGYYIISYVDPYGNRRSSDPIYNSTSATVPVSSYGSTQVTVAAYSYNSVFIRTVGQATIPAINGSTGSGSYTQNLSVNRGATYTVISWNAVSGAVRYHLKYTHPTNGFTYDEYTTNTSFTMNYGTGYSWTLQVFAVSSSNSESFIGGVSITPNGVNQNTGNNSLSGNGTTSTGTNCQIQRNANDAYLVWNPANTGSFIGGNSYRVVYQVEGAQAMQMITNSNACTIPVGSSYTFSVQVYNNYTNAVIAYGTFRAVTNNTNSNYMNITKSEIKNLNVTAVNSYTTKVSWSRPSDATYFIIQYGTLDGTISDEIGPIYTNFYDSIPMGASRGYHITVYYWSKSTSRFKEVGHAYNVPGSTSDDNNNTTVTKNYPSSFKATSGTSKRITLSWTAADGASYYNIYYKRATSSKWIKIDKNITKTAVNVNGLTNGVEYQFKVVPNKGVESGILKIAPSTTSTTVRANDPVTSTDPDDGDVSLDDETLSLRSVSSNSKGAITVSWTNVGAASYRIYVAAANTNTYKYCGTYTGTQATITAFGSGSKATTFKSGTSYKVRVVRSDYKNYGTINSALSACSPLNVTVK